MTRFIVCFFLCLINTAFALNESKTFIGWKTNLIQEAIDSGISKQTVDEALRSIKEPVKKVLKSYYKQKKPPQEQVNPDTLYSYQQKVAPMSIIKAGNKLLQEHQRILQNISRKYQVPAKYIVSIWGIETRYGKYTGGHDAIDALASLAYSSKRKKFFRSELLAALRILDNKHIHLKQMKSSWAGAIGQSQFMPSSFLRYAVDENMDGKKDIWNTKEDIFGSIANYLKKNGWRAGQTWGRRVLLPLDFKTSLIGLNTKKTVLDWSSMGLVTINGRPLPKSKITASVIQPDWKYNSSFLVYKNYEVIRTYNRSHYYALSVSYLASQYKPLL